MKLQIQAGSTALRHRERSGTASLLAGVRACGHVAVLVRRIAAGGSGKFWPEAELPLEKSALRARSLICEALVGNSFAASEAEALDSFSRSL